MTPEKSAISKADYIGQAMSALPDGLPIDVQESTLRQIAWIVNNDRFCDVKDLQARAKKYARYLLKHKKSVQGERPLTCEDFGMKPSDFHEIKESEIPKHTMTFDKHATGAAADQKHYQKAEKEPIEIMQMYFTSEMMHGFCLGNVIKYALRARFKGTEMTDIEKMAQYADWDVQVMRAEKIDPRKVHP